MHEQFQHILDLKDYLSLKPSLWNINHQHELLLLTPLEREQELVRGLYKPPKRPQAFSLWRMSQEGIRQSLEMEESPIRPSVLQSVSGDGFLLVDSHCPKRSGGEVEPNALVIEASGDISSRFVVGDGVGDVQTDRKDRVWVSYFDQGVLGCQGWHDPIGAAGLVRFDLRGKQTWKYSPPSGTPFIFDCYSLNVARNHTWLCYYSGFPVVRVSRDGKKVKAWSNSFHTGTRALAVWEDYVLLAGGYQEERSKATLLKLTEREAQKVLTLDLDLPEDVALLTGRDHYLHYVNDKGWWCLDVRGVV